MKKFTIMFDPEKNTIDVENEGCNSLEIMGMLHAASKNQSKFLIEKCVVQDNEIAENTTQTTLFGATTGEEKADAFPPDIAPEVEGTEDLNAGGVSVMSAEKREERKSVPEEGVTMKENYVVGNSGSMSALVTPEPAKEEEREVEEDLNAGDPVEATPVEDDLNASDLNEAAEELKDAPEPAPETLNETSPDPLGPAKEEEREVEEDLNAGDPVEAAPAEEDLNSMDLNSGDPVVEPAEKGTGDAVGPVPEGSVDDLNG